MPYKFEYDVNHGDNQFGHREQNDGKVTSGSYRVALPDGRTQIVTYRADHNGYNADVTYEQSEYNPIRLSYRPPAPPAYYPPAPAPHYFQAPSYGSPAPPAVKPLVFRTLSSGSGRKPIAPKTTPFYTSPAVPPFGAPAIQDYDESDERSSDPVPLLFRNNVAYKVKPHKEYEDRIPVEYRSAFGKRSLAIDLWNETSILEALAGPSDVEAQVPIVEEIADEVNDYEESVTPATGEVLEAIAETAAPAELEADNPEVYTNDEFDYSTWTEVESFPAPEEVDVEAPVESQTDSPFETYDFGSNVIDFDELPFPLPLPLAYRPYAV